MSEAPERIAFRKIWMSQAITDDNFMDHPDYIQYIRADLATPTHAEQLQQALVMPEIKALVDALQAFNTYEKSAFFGSAAEKNKQAVYRGVKRKITKALAAVGVKP